MLTRLRTGRAATHLNQAHTDNTIPPANIARMVHPHSKCNLDTRTRLSGRRIRAFVATIMVRLQTDDTLAQDHHQHMVLHLLGEEEAIFKICSGLPVTAREVVETLKHRQGNHMPRCRKTQSLKPLLLMMTTHFALRKTYESKIMLAKKVKRPLILCLRRKPRLKRV